MERMLVVVAFLADGTQPRDEVRTGRGDLR
jgi:hypothetical protein